jgi:carbamoyltransferase
MLGDLKAKSLKALVPALLQDVQDGNMDGVRHLIALSADTRIQLRHIERWLTLYPRVDGIVLTGGCALNVIVNTEAKRKFKGYGIYVPAAPHDGGLSVGASWLWRPPPENQHPRLVFSGALLWDVTNSNTNSNSQNSQMPGRISLHELIESWILAAREQEERTAIFEPGIEVLADLLAEGKIIGVMRSRSEFGPRALGHRSLLADPTLLEAKAKMNRLKVREWWRPVAPIVAMEEMDRIFEERVWSPWMSFAPRLWPSIGQQLPAIVHFDGTARCQTLAKHQDPWLHALLMAMKRRNGFGVLCNTSFNVKGRPIINSAAVALELLQSHPDLDYVYVQGWLVRSAHLEVLINN